MTLEQFVQKYNNRSVDEDGAYGNQCWDGAEAYCREVLGIKPQPFALATGPSGTAYGIFNSFAQPNPQYFTKIVRSHLGGLVNFRPKFGDLVIWNNHLPGSEGAGHVAICIADGAIRNFTSFDQNWVPQKFTRLAHDYSYVVGYLRPKKVIK